MIELSASEMVQYVLGTATLAVLVFVLKGILRLDKEAVRMVASLEALQKSHEQANGFANQRLNDHANRLQSHSERLRNLEIAASNRKEQTP